MTLPGVAMSARLTGLRERLGPAPRVRTLAGGVVLGGVFLLATALVGGVGGEGQDAAPPSDEQRPGPMTAVQPELQRALLTDQDLPPATPATGPEPTAAPAPAPAPATTAPPAPPDARPADETPDWLDELCWTLFEDPGGLPALWQVHPPRETTARHTTRTGGSALQQVLTVFEPGDAPEAYGKLHETATACTEFRTVLDGNPVTVLLEQLGADRRESGSWPDGLDRLDSTTADEGYAWQVTVRPEAGDHAGDTLTGWLALDRLGPVVSVLRQLGPEGSLVDDQAETRTTALDKLKPLLRVLDR